MRVAILTLIFITSAFFNSAAAAVYKWVDENGKVHYSDKPVDNIETKEVELNYPKADEQEAAKLRQQTEKLRSKARSNSNTNNYSDAGGSQTDTSEKDKKRCEEYTERYERYKSEGVVGINPMTGQTAMMQGEGKEQAIENARQNAEIFCDY